MAENRDALPLNAIRAFVAIAREASVTGAAVAYRDPARSTTG